MISQKDIQNLASLARLELSERELQEFETEINPILGYVAKVSEVADSVSPTFENKNIFRDDVVTGQTGEYTETLIKLAPSHEGDLVKVKKILE